VQSAKRWVVATGATYVAFGLQFITSPLVARALGPKDRALLGYLQVLALLLPVVAAWGVGKATRFLIGLGAGPAAVRERLLFHLRLSVLIGVPASLLASVICFERGPLETVAAFVMVLAGCATAVRYGIAVVCLTQGRFEWVAFGQVAAAAVVVLFLVPLWALGALTLWTACLAYALSFLVSFGVTDRLSRRLQWDAQDGASVTTRDRFRFGLTSLPGDVGEPLINRLDQLLAIPVLGHALAGSYLVASNWALVLYPLFQTVGLRLSVRNTSRVRSSRETGLIVLGCALLGAVLAGWGIAGFFLIPVIFGAPYKAAAPIAVVLSAAAALAGLLSDLIHRNAQYGRIRTVSLAVAAGCGCSAVVALANPGGNGVGFATAPLAATVVAFATFWSSRARRSGHRAAAAFGSPAEAPGALPPGPQTVPIADEYRAGEPRWPQ